MKKILFGLLTLLTLSANAQEQENKITVKPYGFVGFDAYVDTRQSTTARYGNVYLFPAGQKNDSQDKDRNARSRFDFGANISRLGFAITGPDAFGAKTTAKIEGDFSGYGDGVNDMVLRLRHAFINFDWGKTSLLAGQTWHPFFVTENFPATVNFVCGAPIHPLSRAPQFRYTYKASDDFSLSVIALSQADFANKGGAQQIELSDFPEMNLQLKYGSPKDFFLAATIGAKSQQPVDVNGANEMTTNKVTSMQANLSIRYTTPKVTFKAEGIYGGSMTNMVMIGGIAQKTNNGTPVDAEYTPINVSSFWTDIHTNGSKIQYGVFAGLTTNLGTKDESVIVYDKDNKEVYTLGGSIGKVAAIAPRIVWTSGKVNVGLELLHTVAAYGTPDDHSKPIDTKDYSNNRITLGFRYNF